MEDEDLKVKKVEFADEFDDVEKDDGRQTFCYIEFSQKRYLCHTSQTASV